VVYERLRLIESMTFLVIGMVIRFIIQLLLISSTTVGETFD